jgi:beta-glucosidase
MKTILVILASLLLLYSCGTDNNTIIENPEAIVKFTPPVSEEVALKRANEIVVQMTIDEKLDLIKGYKGFFIKGNEKYGMPDIYLSDASQGVNIRENWHGVSLADYALPKSVAFPNFLALAATWNPELAGNYAKSIGEECRAAGIGVLLGPGLNIYRHSQNGRNFEYLGEDPYLAGKIVEQYVVGVQNTGVIATLKHFVANNTDYKRRASNSVIDERTLQEIYLPAFKRGVDAGAMAVMTSYNLVNGKWAGQSEYVINYLLRDQLGFNNLVMTDWRSVNDVKQLVKSGQDLEMPGGDSMGELKTYIEKGEVDIKDIDRMCTRIIKTLAQMNYLDTTIKDTNYLRKFEEHEEVALNTAREGIVLLRNQNNLLPIKEGTKKNILITGTYVTENVYGGGSGRVKGYDIITIIEALKKVYPNITYKEKATDEDIKSADYVMVSVGTFDYEGCDRHFSLQKEQEELVQKAASLNANTIVIVNSGGAIRMTDWQKVKAIIYNWYPGQIGNVALAEILTGKTNPSGKLPMSIEKEFKDSPGNGYLPEGAKFICDIDGYLDINNTEIDRWSYDINIKNAADSIYDVNYNEGVLVGYRWYDTKNIEPLFPFGYGLSYTNFELRNSIISSVEISKKETLKVSVDVANVGDIAGATVVQLYVSEKNPTVIRPLKELKAFNKVFLEAGESKTVNLYLKKEAFAFWSEDSMQWEVNEGEFEILLGQSSRDISSTLKVIIN